MQIMKLIFSISHMGQEMSFEELHDGYHAGHLGYQNGIILRILNLHVDQMPATMF